MRNILSAIGVIAYLGLSVQQASAVPIQWRIEDGGNGHWYELISNNWTTWQQARNAAQACEYQGLPGDLATITSEEESKFIEEAFDIGPWTGWLGGYQSPSGYPLNENWHWISQWEGTPYEQVAEEWDYTDWLPDQPSYNWEDGLSIYLHHDGVSQASGWNDAARNGVNSYGYNALVEYVPEPATLGLLAAGGLALLRRKRK